MFYGSGSAPLGTVGLVLGIGVVGATVGDAEGEPDGARVGTVGSRVGRPVGVAPMHGQRRRLLPVGSASQRTVSTALPLSPSPPSGAGGSQEST